VAGRASKIGSILLAVVWVAVVCAAVALAIARRETQGVYTYIILGMAALMLLLFAVNYLPRWPQTERSAETVGKFSLGLLLLCIIILLAVSLVKGYRTIGLIGDAALLLFLVTFVRIFVSYVKDMGIRFSVRERKDNEKGD
jgi:peptidoglycan/LPS O-acetylase OafA/YrhL